MTHSPIEGETVNNTATTSPWLDYRGAARYLGVGVGTLRNLAGRRVIPLFKQKGIVRFRREHLDAWLEGGLVPAEEHTAVRE